MPRNYPKKESKFISEFIKVLLELVPDMYYYKSHGEPMQTRGIPDIVASINGNFVGMEFKIMKNRKLNITPYQEYNLEKIFKSKGIALVIWFDEINGDIGIQTKRFTYKKYRTYPNTLKTAANYLIKEIRTIRQLHEEFGTKIEGESAFSRGGPDKLSRMTLETTHEDDP